MTKREIVRTIADKLHLTQLQTKDIVQHVLDCLSETLVEEGRVELRNFGIFEVRKRKARKARNPKTGEAVKVKEKTVVVFKSGKAMEDALHKRNRKTSPKKTDKSVPQ
jgi:nucleoid DNA-binding protein